MDEKKLRDLQRQLENIVFKIADANDPEKRKELEEKKTIVKNEIDSLKAKND